MARYSRSQACRGRAEGTAGRFRPGQHRHRSGGTGCRGTKVGLETGARGGPLSARVHRSANTGPRSGHRAPGPSESEGDGQRPAGAANRRRPCDSTRRSGRRPGFSKSRFARARKRSGGRSITRPDGTAGSDKVVLDQIPEFASVFGSKFLWPPNLGVRLADVPQMARPFPGLKSNGTSWSISPCAMRATRD